jgi:hypothetical protein
MVNIMLSIFMLTVTLPSDIMLSGNHANYQYAEFHLSFCNYAECSYSDSNLNMPIVIMLNAIRLNVVVVIVVAPPKVPIKALE